MLHVLRRTSSHFRTRSLERDEENDRKTLSALGAAIDKALAALRAERNGLGRRFDEARDRASLSVGTEHDEYLSREPEVLADLKRAEEEMIQAKRRLKVLDDRIADLQFVRDTFYSRLGASLAARDG